MVMVMVMVMVKKSCGLPVIAGAVQKAGGSLGECRQLIIIIYRQIIVILIIILIYGGEGRR